MVKVAIKLTDSEKKKMLTRAVIPSTLLSAAIGGTTSGYLAHNRLRAIRNAYGSSVPASVKTPSIRGAVLKGTGIGAVSGLGASLAGLTLGSIVNRVMERKNRTKTAAIGPVTGLLAFPIGPNPKDKEESMIKIAYTLTEAAEKDIKNEREPRPAFDPRYAIIPGAVGAGMGGITRGLGAGAYNRFVRGYHHVATPKIKITDVLTGKTKTSRGFVPGPKGSNLLLNVPLEATKGALSGALSLGSLGTLAGLALLLNKRKDNPDKD